MHDAHLVDGLRRVERHEGANDLPVLSAGVLLCGHLAEQRAQLVDALLPELGRAPAHGSHNLLLSQGELVPT